MLEGMPRLEEQLRGAYLELASHQVPVGSGLVRLGAVAPLLTALRGEDRYLLARHDPRVDRWRFHAAVQWALTGQARPLSDKQTRFS
jgi:hypothetical protein